VAAINTEYKEPSYGNWRVPRTTGRGHLGAIGTGITMAGLLVGIIAFALWASWPGWLSWPWPGCWSCCCR
jgi:hypothetical protein